MKSLAGHLLIAAPRLMDPNFFRTVVLMVQHNEQGALGLVLNRPTDTTVSEAWEQIDDIPCPAEGFIHQGGPCEGPLMAVHGDDTASEIEVMPGVHFSTDRDALNKLVANTSAPMKFFVGYAGWSPGQLETELEDGGWLVVAATAPAVFTDDPEQWTKIMKQINASSLYSALDPKVIPPDPSMN
ncbi:MAG: YqgE/AlgH family protein [Tepidisphaerales bacterium]